MASTSTVLIVAQVAGQVLSIIYFGVGLCGIAKLWNRWDEHWMQKRNPQLTVIQNIAIMLLILGLALDLSVDLRTFDVFRPIRLFVSLVLNGSFWLFAWCLVTRSWLVFFTIKWTQCSLRNGWQQLINSRKSDPEWFVEKHSSFGNDSFMAKLFAAVCGTAFALNFFVAASGPTMLDLGLFPSALSVALKISTVAAVAAFYGVVAAKTPHFDDPMHIYWESRVTAKFIAVAVVVAALFQIFGALISAFGDETAASMLTVLTGGFFWNLWGFCLIWVCTFRLVALSVPNNEMKLALYSSNESVVNPSISLQMILENADAIRLYMGHLAKTYNMGLLLSYIEFTQFQLHLVATLSVTDFIDKHRVTFSRFPDNVPISEIVAEHKGDAIVVGGVPRDVAVERAKNMAFRLYSKYIAMGSEYEIKIPFSVRNRLKHLLSDKDNLMTMELSDEKLLLLFEQSKKVMAGYMRHTITSFKSSGDFARIVAIFSPATPSSRS